MVPPGGLVVSYALEREPVHRKELEEAQADDEAEKPKLGKLYNHSAWPWSGRCRWCLAALARPTLARV
jgi:hypothetical protein